MMATASANKLASVSVGSGDSGDDRAIFSTLPDDSPFHPEHECIMLPAMLPAQETKATPSRSGKSKWVLLLVLPYLGLCFPQLYAHATPTLWGFPFFYWYKLAW